MRLHWRAAKNDTAAALDVSLLFPAQKHGDCSEIFYKASIINEVQGRDDVDNEDRIKVMDMLRRLQEADGEEETGLDTDDQEQENIGQARLASALADFDLGESSITASGFAICNRVL